MHLSNLEKKETRLTTTDELIEAITKESKYHQGIRLYFIDTGSMEGTYIYGSQSLSYDAMPNKHVKIFLGSSNKTFLTINDSSVIMNSLGHDKVEIDLNTLEDIDFFQYECLGVDLHGISSDMIKSLIKYFEGVHKCI
ncbi:hypothetical protein VWH18_05570 [Escherichia coli O157]|nr:hypothetical protein [Escherichia coli]MED6572919.1 hypothetical protein [Escherichia coli O157]